MEIRIEKLKLKKLLDKVQSVIPQKSVVPAEEYLKFDITEHYIAVSAYSSGVTASAKLDNQFYDSASFCVVGKDLITAVSKIKAKEILLTVQEELKIKFNTSELSLPLFSTDDFITPKQSGVVSGAEVDAYNLTEGIRNSLPFVLNGFQEHPLSCVWFDFKDNNLDVVCSDKAIMNMSSTFCECEDMSIGVSPSSAQSIFKMFEDLEDCNVSIEANERNVTFRTPNRKITVTRTNHVMPNFNSIIPDFDTFIDVKKDNLLEILPLAEKFSSKGKDGSFIALESNGRKLTINGSDRDYNTKIISEVEILDGFHEFKVGLGVKHLTTLVNSSLDEVVKMFVGSERQAVVIKEMDRTMLIMPVLI